jgi:drug/metabolite transporter (DMT)-like permease
MALLGELSALLTACLWSGSSIAFASATRRAGSIYVNVTRLFLAAGFLIVLVWLARFDVSVSNKQILFLGLSGIVGLSLGDSFLFKAYQEIGARITMLIMSLAPAIAAVLALVVLNEELSPVGVLGIVITIAGVSIVVLERSNGEANSVASSVRSHLTTTGIICAMLAATGQGSGLVLAKVAFRESAVNGFVAATIRILSSLVILFPAALFAGRYSYPIAVFRRDRKAFPLTVLGAILGPFLGIAFSLIAIENTKVGIAATIMAIVPILMLPLVRIIYKERLNWRAVAGAFVAVGGVAVLFLR